ncbi:MAG: helicase-associated domain-containing protein, partial [Planctomycetes bacterium]|nr:helicase-associated domain-containing protein [Planctomycetota bacterium]
RGGDAGPATAGAGPAPAAVAPATTPPPASGGAPFLARRSARTRKALLDVLATSGERLFRLDLLPEYLARTEAWRHARTLEPDGAGSAARAVPWELAAVATTLHGLGFAEMTETAGRPAAIRLSVDGRRALSSPTAAFAPPAAAERTFLVMANQEVVAALDLELEVLRGLLPVLELRTVDLAVTGTLTRDAVQRARLRGLSARDVRDFLRSHARNELPQPVAFFLDDLERIESWFEVVPCSAVVALRGGARREELEKLPEARRLLGREVAPGVYLVPPGATVPEVRELLVRQGLSVPPLGRAAPASDPALAELLAAPAPAGHEAGGAATDEPEAWSLRLQADDAEGIGALLRQAALEREEVEVTCEGAAGREVRKLVPRSVRGDLLEAEDADGSPTNLRLGRIVGARRLRAFFGGAAGKPA